MTDQSRQSRDYGRHYATRPGWRTESGISLRRLPYLWRQEPSDLLNGGLAILPLAPLAATKAKAPAVIRAMQQRIAEEARP